MNQFESQVVAVPYSQQRVYDMLSDLSHLEAVKDRIPQDKIKDLRFDCDTVSINVAPVGDIVFKIVETHIVKFASTTEVSTFTHYPLNVQYL